jgi:hypothetical protein
MDEKNHHLHKSVFIGEIKADGQFNVVWKTPGPVKAKPWSPYIEGTPPSLTSQRRSKKPLVIARREATWQSMQFEFMDRHAALAMTRGAASR